MDDVHRNDAPVWRIHVVVYAIGRNRMKVKEIDKDTKVVDILEYGQGYDDEIAEIFKAFNKFRDGYYELTNYGDDWWKVFNQDTMFDEMMQTQWGEIEKIDMMEVIEKMAKAMVGTYVRFGAFAKVVIDADKNKMGFRHEEKQNES